MTDHLEQAKRSTLLAGVDDWMSLAEIVSYVRHDLPDASPLALRAATISFVGGLLQEDLIRIGDLSPSFVPWSVPTADAIRQIERDWTLLPGQLDHAQGWWFDLTERGRDAAASLSD